MKRAAGIVTDHGGTTSHAAIVSRELGVAAIVGTGDASSVIGDGQDVTLSCAEGDTGTVYEGLLDFDQSEIDVRSEEHTSELQSLMRISYAVFCLKTKQLNKQHRAAHREK